MKLNIKGRSLLAALMLVSATSGNNVSAQVPPIITQDTLPTAAFDVEGSRVTFTVSVDGSRPLTYQWYKDSASVPNATNATLTLSNLQLTDAGSYSLQASNEFGFTNSTASALAVDPLPADVNGVVISPASQLGFGGTNTFSPTWVLATNNLIGGKAPSSSAGDFTLLGARGIPVLTDGTFGTLPAEGNTNVEVATCGLIGSGAGSSLVYTLPAASNGYDLTNVIVYGGWSDASRDQQHYSLFYSTVASPTNFDNLIAFVDFQPINTANAQSATRVTLTGTNGIVARNVAALRFDFNVLVSAVENGFTGYAEFQTFGQPSAPAPVLSVDTQPATASDVVGSQMIFVAAFRSDTPLSYQWRKNIGNGPVNIPGATNPTLTLNNLQLSDSGAYSVKASNAADSSFSRSSTLVVNPLPAPDASGVIVSPANQTGTGARFTPTWPIPAGSLIARSAPSAKVGNVGSFMAEGAGGLMLLTDGTYGAVGSANNSTLATCGTSTGNSVTYTLNGSQSGFDLTNIMVYAGWSDKGRDQQAYTISYSTVADPNNFIDLSSTDYNPDIATGISSADRVTFTSSTAAPLAANVARIKFDFTNPSGENGYSGYAELTILGSPSATVSLPPVLMTDTLPATGSDVEGSEVTFTAVFSGKTPITYQWRKDIGGGPVDIPGATSATLKLSNLTLSDSGSYSVLAANSLGTAPSTPNNFTVNSAPTPANGILVADANQTSSGAAFSPTWTIAPGSLLAGLAPSTVGGGNFATEGAGGIVILTDGKFGSVGAVNSTLASCGVNAGTNLTYTLAGSASGYDLTRIVTYGGWGDNGRDEQHYTVSYSTVLDPATFVTLVSADYNPTVDANIPTADRITITSATTAPLATNVSAVKFDFTNPAGENGWSGYAELSLFGVASTPVKQLTFESTTVTNGNLVMAGAGGTPGASYTVLESTNAAAPLSSWITNRIGVFDATGAFSTAIPIQKTAPAWFFTLRVP